MTPSTCRRMRAVWTWGFIPVVHCAAVVVFYAKGLPVVSLMFALTCPAWMGLMWHAWTADLKRAVILQDKDARPDGGSD